MKRDTKDILLQKYVAGLLTMKVDCPNTVNDIAKLKAYQNFGNAFIEAGGTIAEIQKLYQENGGTLSNTASLDDTNIDNEPIEDEPDFPSYDDLDLMNDYDNLNDEEDDEEDDNYSMNRENPFADDEDFLADEFDINIDKMEFKEPEQPKKYKINNVVKKSDLEEGTELTRYFKTVPNIVSQAKIDQYITWDDNKGIILTSEETDNIIGKCVGTTFNFIDKKPRFIVGISNEDISLGNNGNNGVYDDYYYTVKKPNMYSGKKSHIKVTPGSNFYYQEENNGEFYTNILADNDNMPAKYVKSYLDKMIRQNTISLDNQELIDLLKTKIYLPTLPELVNIIDKLKTNKYWTSTVDNNGRDNVILDLTRNDNIIKTHDKNETAKVVIFIKF
jgi:hypothetical protein